MTTNWTPESWRTRPIKQQPTYERQGDLDAVLGTIRAYPPLVFVGEVDNLKRQLAEAAAGYRAAELLALADSFAAALARLRKAELVTADRDFKSVEQEIKIIWLKNP